MHAISWLEQNGYDVSYMAGVDVDRYGSLLLNHKVYIDAGHDEYWSGQQRTNVEAARDAGVNLQFWSGNEVYWRTRWGNALSSDATPYRTLISYKETWAERLDRSHQPVDRDLPRPALQPAGDRRGQSGELPDRDNLPGRRRRRQPRSITVPYDDANLRFWAQYKRRQSSARPDGDADEELSRLRVGRSAR